jgi:hypothetical protein
MSYGVPPKTTHSLPPGRRSFTESTKRIVSGPQSEIVRPGRYADGQDQNGTPASNQHHSGAANAGYLDRSAVAHRASEGSQPYPTESNPRVSSKNDKRYGRDGSKLSGATFKSTGGQPAGQQRDQIAPSWAPTAKERATPHSERVGWVNGKYVAPTHPNMGKHDPGHHGALHANTDAAQGQAWHASGGQFGKRSPQPAPTNLGTGTGREDAGALERGSYNRPARK